MFDDPATVYSAIRPASRRSSGKRPLAPPQVGHDGGVGDLVVEPRLHQTSCQSAAKAATAASPRQAFAPGPDRRAQIVGPRSSGPDRRAQALVSTHPAPAAAADVAAHEATIGVLINNLGIIGSLAITDDPTPVESSIVAPLYTPSKAALIMSTTQYAKGLTDVRINAVDPGYTTTDLIGHSGPQTVTEGTDAIVALTTEGPANGSGRFVDRVGEISWS